MPNPKFIFDIDYQKCEDIISIGNLAAKNVIIDLNLKPPRLSKDDGSPVGFPTVWIKRDKLREKQKRLDEDDPDKLKQNLQLFPVPGDDKTDEEIIKMDTQEEADKNGSENTTIE